jgi:hypothetical protein
VNKIFSSLIAAISCAWATSIAHAALIIDSVIIPLTDTATYNTLTNSGVDAFNAEIFERMIASSEVFIFDDNTHALQHFLARKWVTYTINDMYELGVINWSYGQPGSYQFPSSFEPYTTDRLPTVDQTYYFIQSDPMQAASAALEDFYFDPIVAECQTAMEAAIILGHYIAYGSTWIDSKFLPGSLLFDGVFRLVDGSNDGFVYVPGDVVYMRNKPDYLAKARAIHNNVDTMYPYTGENAVYVYYNSTNFEAIYSGLGMLNQTEEQIREVLRDGYSHDTGEDMSYNDSLEFIYFDEFHKIHISDKV